MSMLGYYMALSSLKASGGIPTDGLVRQWDFINDSLVDTVSGTLIAKGSLATFVDGYKGNRAIYSNSNTNTILFATPVTNIDISISFWYTTTGVISPLTGVVIDGRNGIAPLCIIIPYFGEIYYTWFPSTIQASINTTYHICVVKSNLTAKIYINGVLVLTNTSSFSNSTYHIRGLGSFVEDPAYGAKGTYEKIRKYNRGLTDTEVLSLYNE